MVLELVYSVYLTINLILFSINVYCMQFQKIQNYINVCLLPKYLTMSCKETPSERLNATCKRAQRRVFVVFSPTRPSRALGCLRENMKQEIISLSEMSQLQMLIKQTMVSAMTVNMMNLPRRRRDNKTSRRQSNNAERRSTLPQKDRQRNE